MNLFFILKKSLQLPKKAALFQLNRVSMRDTITYMVILMLLLFIPDVVTMILDTEGMTEGMSYSTYVIQILVFYPFLILFLVVAGISLLALVSLLLTKILGRKLAYQSLWKMTSYALTYPLLMYTVLKLVHINYVVINLIPVVLLYVLICKMILVYPKR